MFCGLKCSHALKNKHSLHFAPCCKMMTYSDTMKEMKIQHYLLAGSNCSNKELRSNK